jgi:2-polyprenyl-3-methyl-5-hydroxy-6-metoxy-1,4-benzoquinol methylase
LDIGCGEGFITEKLPAAEIYGLDLSDNAMSRLPQIVKAVTKPEGKFDLVIVARTVINKDKPCVCR